MTLGGWLVFAQSFDRRFLIGTIVAIIGSMILGLDDFIYEVNQIQGDTIALISAFFFAVYFLLIEQIRNRLKVITIMFYYCAIGIVLSLPFLLISKETILPSSLSGWLTVICLATTLLFINYFIIYSLKWLSSGLVTVVLLLEPILSAILAWAIFSEALDFWNMLAFPVVLLGIYLATTSQLVIKDESLIE